MSTHDERLEAALAERRQDLADHLYAALEVPWFEANEIIDALFSYYDNNEPALGQALRQGLREAGWLTAFQREPEVGTFRVYAIDTEVGLS